MLKKSLVALCAFSSLSFAQNALELNINSKSVEIGFDTHLNYYASLDPASKYQFSLNYLKVDDKPNMFRTGFLISNPFRGLRGVSFGAGLKYVFARESDSKSNFHAIALMLGAKVDLSQELFLDLNFGYSPSVLSFSDAQSYSEYGAKINFKLVKSAFIYAGYRYQKTKYEDFTIKYDDSFMFGIKFLF